MGLRAKFGFTAAVILASTLGYVNLGYVNLVQAAPLGGVVDTISAMLKAQMPDHTDGLIQKAHHTGYCHTHHKGHVYKCKSHHHEDHAM